MKRNGIIQFSVEFISFIISFNVANIISKSLGITNNEFFSLGTIGKVLIMAVVFAILEIILFKIVDKFTENKNLN